jgi:ATP-binding cassette subfamily B protein
MDSLQKQRPFSQVIIFLLLYMVLCIVETSFSSWYRHVLTPKTNVIIQEYVMTQIYNQAIRVDLSCYENPDFYDNYTKANEEILTRVINILNNVSWISGILFSIIASLIAIVTYEPLILPIVIIPAIIVHFVDKNFTKVKYDRDMKNTVYRRQMEYVKRTVYMQDYAKDLRLSNIFRPILKNFHEAIDNMKSITHEYSLKAALLRFFRDIIMVLATYSLVQGLIVYRYLKHHAYSLGALTTILNAATNLIRLISQFTFASAYFYENGMYIENFKTFLEYEPKMVENPQGKSPKKEENNISIKNISFTYEGQAQPILKNISMEIPAGQKIALVGHNGAGKSTFVKLLMRLYEVTEGEIQLDKVNIKDYKLSEYRGIFGTIFQDFKIFATTITENVLLYPPKSQEDIKRAEEAIKASGLYGKIENLEKGMDSLLTKEFDDKGVLMSGGEFQKIAIARVFAKESSIAILDEPSSALDPISEYEMFENMMKACENKTVIFVSHRLSSAILADKIYMMEDGSIVEEGSHEELMNLEGKYAEMFKMQAEKYREEEGAIA